MTTPREMLEAVALPELSTPLQTYEWDCDAQDYKPTGKHYTADQMRAYARAYGAAIAASLEGQVDGGIPHCMTKEGEEACPWYGKWKQLERHICKLYDAARPAQSEDETS